MLAPCRFLRIRNVDYLAQWRMVRDFCSMFTLHFNPVTTEAIQGALLRLGFQGNFITYNLIKMGNPTKIL